MKIFLSIILALVIFFTFVIYANASPPPEITIRSEEELAKMREMVTASDEELQNYLWKMDFWMNGIRTREHLISFLELLDSLPILFDTEMYFTSLIYNIESRNKTFDIFFRSITGEIHTYRLFTAGDKGKSSLEESMGGEQLIEIFRSQDDRMIVYSPPKSLGFFPNVNGNYIFIIEIDGYFIDTLYNPGRSSATEVTAEKVYGNMIITSIRDITWIDRNQPGDIFGEGFVTTANALEILRFVAGLEHDIRSQSAMAAADVNGDGKIDTADALEILRIVAGLV
jgi:hypothetical protein